MCEAGVQSSQPPRAPEGRWVVRARWTPVPLERWILIRAEAMATRRSLRTLLVG